MADSLRPTVDGHRHSRLQIIDADSQGRRTVSYRQRTNVDCRVAAAVVARIRR